MATTRKILTKQQVEELLSQYISTQTAAAQADEEAYNTQADTQQKNDQKELEEAAAKAKKAAADAYDTQTVKALVSRRRLAEQLANRGLSRSGAMTLSERSQKRVSQLAARTLAKALNEAKATLERKTLALQAQTNAKKQKNTASSQKALQNRIAEKRLSLSKLMY